MRPCASSVRRPAAQAMWPRTAMRPPAPSCRMDTSPAKACAYGLGSLGSKWPMPKWGSVLYLACSGCSCDG
eukprot:10599959-Alexandrium_andersonii.AAC.1